MIDNTLNKYVSFAQGFVVVAVCFCNLNQP